MTRVAPLLALFLLSACAGAPPPPPPPPPKVDPPPPPPAPAPEGRWVARDGHMSMGPALGTGTLALMGGRRVLLKADGTVESDAAGDTPLLAGLAGVPTEKGTVVVGWDRYNVYRVTSATEPLKLIAHTDYIVGVLTAPGKLIVKASGTEVPVALDIETGDATPFEMDAPFAVYQMRFADMNNGAAVFDHAGLQITTDGGKTWKKASAASMRVTQYATLFQSGKDVLIRNYERDADLVANWSTLSFDKVAGAADEHTVRKWIRWAESDAAHAAAQSGLIVDEKTVAVVSGRAAALVDLGTLLPTRIWQLNNNVYGCSPTHLLKDGHAEFVCPGAGAARVRIPTKDPKAKLGFTELNSLVTYASTSGAVLGMGACNAKPDEDMGGLGSAEACVIDPDGKATTHKIGSDEMDVYSASQNAGPLASGGVALVEFKEDKPVTVKFVGVKRDPVTLSLKGFGRVNNYVDEDVDGTLRFVVRGDAGRSGVEITKDGKATVRELPAKVRMFRKQAFEWLYENNEMNMSRDFGKTWVSLGKNLPDGMGIPETFSSDVGVATGQYVYLGTTVPAAPVALAEMHGKKIRFTDSKLEVKCTTEAKFKAPTKTPTAIAEALKGPAAPKGHTTKHVHDWASVGTLAGWTITSKEGSPPTPTKWTFRWVSTHDLGATKLREASIAPPKDVQEPRYLSSVQGEGDRLFLVLTGGKDNKNHLVRVDGTKVSIVPAPASYVSRSVIGYGNGKPIFFQAGNQLYAWYDGKQPEKLGPLQGTFTFGTDAKGQLALVATRNAFAPRSHLTSTPPKPGSGTPLWDADPGLGFAKWVNVPVQKEFPLCDAKAKGIRYHASVSLNLTVDGKYKGGPSYADVILRPEGPCLASIEMGTYSKDFWVQVDVPKKKTWAVQASTPVGMGTQFQCTVAVSAPAKSEH